MMVHSIVDELRERAVLSDDPDSLDLRAASQIEKLEQQVNRSMKGWEECQDQVDRLLTMLERKD